MKLKIEIEMDNAAFDGEAAGQELANILRGAADECEYRVGFESGDWFSLMDINGNKVGEARFKE